MLKFTTNGKNGVNVLTYPTSLDEITPEYLKEVTNDIVLSENYSLIGVCYREKLSNIILSVRQNKKSTDIPVVPIFIKGRKDIETGDKLVISPSQIAIGHHVNAKKNVLTINNLLHYVDGDGMAFGNASKYKDFVYFLEFKIVPNCDIVGYYKKENDKDFENPFKVVPTDLTAIV